MDTNVSDFEFVRINFAIKRIRYELDALTPGSAGIIKNELREIKHSLSGLQSLYDKENYIDPAQQIAITWDIADVKGIRPDLRDAQCMDVLHHVKNSHDAGYGITWDNIEHCADELYPLDGPAAGLNSISSIRKKIDGIFEKPSSENSLAL